MIKKLTNSVLGVFGCELRRRRPPPPSRLEAFFQTWKSLNEAPSFIIDVGANHGSWTRSAFDYFPTAKYLMVEPQDRLKEYSHDLLQRPGTRWLNAGICDQVGSMRLTLPPRDDSATFSVSEKDAQALGYRQIDVPVTTLDEIVRQEQQIPEMVKIDAEGFDLRALKGASKLLGVTEVFFAECTICEPQNENTLKAVCSFMWEKGYRIFDFTDLNHSPKYGALWLTEAVFVRESSPVWGKIPSYS